jgi:hypothetical protein
MNTQKLREYRHALSTRARYKLLSQAMGEMSDSLEKLGFDSYGDYLKSNLWQGIRRRIFGRAKSRCEGCGVNRAEQVHHWSYSVATLQGERPQHLEAVCDECHAQFHEQPLTEVQRNRKADKKAAEKVAYWALVRAGGAIAQPRDMTPRLVRKSA